MKTRCLFYAFVALFASFLPAAAKADSIGLSASNGNYYTYDLLLSGSPVSFNAGDTFTISGLSGVTGVALSSFGTSYGTFNYTDSLVVFTLDSPFTYYGGTGSDIPLFTIAASTSGLGTAMYTFNENGQAVSGTVAAAPTPEPSSLLLLGTGALSLTIVGVRRRQSRQRPLPLQAPTPHAPPPTRYS